MREVVVAVVEASVEWCWWWWWNKCGVVYWLVAWMNGLGLAEGATFDSCLPAFAHEARQPISLSLSQLSPHIDSSAPRTPRASHPA